MYIFNFQVCSKQCLFRTCAISRCDLFASSLHESCLPFNFESRLNLDLQEVEILLCWEHHGFHMEYFDRCCFVGPGYYPWTSTISCITANFSVLPILASLVLGGECQTVNPWRVARRITAESTCLARVKDAPYVDAAIYINVNVAAIILH